MRNYKRNSTSLYTKPVWTLFFSTLVVVSITTYSVGYINKQSISVTPTKTVLAHNGTVVQPELLHENPHSVAAATDSLVVESNIKSEANNPGWQQVIVKSGDSLALIFSRLKLSPGKLYRVMSLGGEVSALKDLKPNEVLHFHIVNNELLGLEYQLNLTQILKLTKKDDSFLVTVITEPLKTVMEHAHVTVTDSFFLSAKRAGLSDKLIMQVVDIYGWDIDFLMDIHEHDTFTVIYQGQYKNGVKISDGPIIAAKFVNQDHSLRAVRYSGKDGRVDYYNNYGDAMRAAFIRTPLKFTRISSHFNLKRKHPILKKIRAHKGIDYAAPTGTPIKATGDGVVTLRKSRGGYGKTVMIQHGTKYQTLYAHLSRYAKSLRVGSRVKQGQVIGYVGQTGLSTGPHLHYEFRVNGIHRDPYTVELPKSKAIAHAELPEFYQAIVPMLLELDKITSQQLIAAKQPAALLTQQF